MPTEKPILFSGPMIRAILNGTKTQTRRCVKMAGIDFRGGGGKAGPDWNDPSCWGFEDEDGREWALAPGDCVDDVIPSPYGRIGYRLWVRETWQCIRPGDRPGSLETCMPRIRLSDGKLYTGDGERIIYRATYDQEEPPCWRPSIHMPRWACRIVLEKTDERIERLQAMSFPDWVADFCPSYVEQERARATFTGWDNQREMAQAFWDSINGKRHGCSWADNPWVRVISFKRVK